MIPRISYFSGSTIADAIASYTETMPLFLSRFEFEHGPAIPSIVSVYFANNEHVIVASIWQDKAKADVLSAMSTLQQFGSNVINDASKQLQNLFASEDCQHEYEMMADNEGNQKLMCIHCKTPL